MTTTAASTSSSSFNVTVQPSGRSFSVEREEAILPAKGVIEFAPESKKASLHLWPEPGSDC